MRVEESRRSFVRVGVLAEKEDCRTVSNSDRPSGPSPAITPDGGFLRPGLVYVDDSATARSTMRRALYAESLLLDTYESRAALRARTNSTPIIAALLDVDLGEGDTGVDVANDLRASFPNARIAFITAEMSPARVEQLRAFGTVFDKTREIAAAASWLIEAYRSHGTASAGDSRSGAG